MISPFDGIDWDHYMRTVPTDHKPLVRKPDSVLPTALKRGLMLMYLNEFKPTKAPKKMAEMKKISRFVRKFVQ
jgi:hypothetical protein